MSTLGELWEWGMDQKALKRFFERRSDGVMLLDGEPLITGGGSGGSAHTIQDDGVDVTDRSNLNFTGTAVSISDDSGNDATVVTIDNLTDGEVKTAYENNADTNAFTDAEKTKLAGIETAATADQSDAEIETAYNNQVGAMSQETAEAGVSTTVERVTAQRIAQAIAAQAILPGYAAIQIPGTVFEPAASGGSNGLTTDTVGTNTITSNVFPDGSDTTAMASNVLMPLDYDSSQSVEFQVEWSVNSTSTNDVRFTLATVSQGEGDSLSATLNTAAAVTDTNSATANQRHVTAWTSLTVTGLTAGESFLLNLGRTATNAADTLAADVRVHAVRIRYTRQSI